MSNKVVFKKVTTQEEREIFHQIKRVVWEGNGYEMEYGREGSDLYIAYVNGVPGGTFEFTPYHQFTSASIKKLFVDVVNKNMSVVELDSFAVLPEYRGSLGRELIRFMISYAQTHEYTHAISILAPSLFVSFNKTYHIRSKQVSETMWYKGDDVIPTISYLKDVYDNLEDEKYSWYETPVELKEKEEVFA